MKVCSNCPDACGNPNPQYCSKIIQKNVRKYNSLQQRTKRLIIFLKWVFHGRKIKKVKGGWCGLCGAWLDNAEFEFPEYYQIDESLLGGDLITMCEKGKCRI
jgi:hypothetical protein